MEKKILIGILVIGIIFVNFSFINATNYPAPFISGTPAEIPTCDYGESYYDNSQEKWLCPVRVINSHYSNTEMPVGTCIEETCPGRDQTKCYCSRRYEGSGQVQAGNIQTALVQTMPNVGGESHKLYTEKDLEKKCENSGDCWYRRRCSPFGTIMNGQYCGIDYSNSKNIRFMDQKQEGENCDENFECLSNNCIENKCTSYIQLKFLKEGTYDDEYKVNKENITKELSIYETSKVQNETDLIQPLLQKISELEERIKFLEEQLNKTQIQQNKTIFSITGNIVSNFEKEADIPSWNKLRNLFKRNE